jgi:hypothetical protein
LKSWGHQDGGSKIIIDLFCLADKDSGASVGRSNQNEPLHSENSDGEKAEEKALLLAGIITDFLLSWTIMLSNGSLPDKKNRH